MRPLDVELGPWASLLRDTLDLSLVVVCKFVDFLFFPGLCCQELRFEHCCQELAVEFPCCGKQCIVFLGKHVRRQDEVDIVALGCLEHIFMSDVVGE